MAFDYTNYYQLEYIESTGTQYIKTGFTDNNKTRLYVDCAYTANTDGSGHGAFTTSSNGRLHFGPQGNDTNIHYGIGNNNNSTNVGSVFDRHTYDADCVTQTMSIDGSTVWTSSSNISSTRELYLFKINTNTTQYYNAYAKCKLYEAKIWNNGSLSRHYIPAQRIADGVVGLYDIVNNSFKTNNGSGTFVAGPIVYEVTTSANPSAYGSTTGDGFYPNGSSVTVTATANAGYVFTNWTDNGVVVSTNPSYTFTISADTDLVANFVPAVSYTVTATEDPVGTGTVSGAGTYYSGQTATLTAVANAGYGFVSWTENGVVVSTASTYSFTVSGDVDLVAHFDVVYTITTDVSPVGAGTVTGGGTYANGATATLTATPSSSKYLFIGWNDGDTNNPRTITVTADATYVATFVEQKLPANFVPCSSILTQGIYFDTGVVPSDDLNCTGMFGYTGMVYPAYLFGARNTSSETSAGQLGFSYYADTKWRLYYGSSYQEMSDNNNDTYVRVENVNNVFDVSALSRYYPVEATSSTFTGTQNVYLLGLNNAGTASVVNEWVRMSVFKMEQGGAVIHEWIPVYDTDTSTFVLYDLVDGTTLSPQGGGTFQTMCHFQIQGSTGGSAYIEHDVLGQVSEAYTQKMITQIVDPDRKYLIQGCTINAVEARGYSFLNWTDQNGDVISTDKNTFIAPNADIVLTANFVKNADLQDNKYQLLGLEYGMGVWQSQTPSADGRLSNFYTTVKDFSIYEDGLARSTSTITVDEVPSVYQVNMGVVLFSPKGQPLWCGIIKNIEGNILTCREAMSLLDGDYMFRPNSSYLKHSITLALNNTVLEPYMVGKPDYWRTVYNASVKRACQVYHRIITYNYPRYDRLKNPLVNIPEITDYTVGNAEDYVFQMFDQFGVVVRGQYELHNSALASYVPNKSIIRRVYQYCNQRPLLYIGTNVEVISNVNIQDENQQYTSVDIFGSTGVSIRGCYSMDANGNIFTVDDANLPNTIAFNDCNRKTEMSDDAINTIVKQYLGNAKFNHKITFTVDLSQDIYHFDDFEIGRWVKFYDGDKVYDTMITGYSFNYSKDDIKTLNVVLGNVRTSLTDKLNMRKV